MLPPVRTRQIDADTITRLVEKNVHATRAARSSKQWLLESESELFLSSGHINTRDAFIFKGDAAREAAAAMLVVKL